MVSSGFITKIWLCIQIVHSPPFFLYHRSSIVRFFTIIPSSAQGSFVAANEDATRRTRIKNAITATPHKFLFMVRIYQTQRALSIPGTVLI